MAAKLLHSLTDENPDLQSQLGCMTGIFQLFDRQHVLTNGRRIVGQSPKRLPPGNSHYSNGTVDRDTNNAHLRSSSMEKYSNKSMQDGQRVSTESSRASFSSSSRSSSFSSLDCNNKASQLEQSSFERVLFPETPSRDSSVSHYSRQSLDLRDLVKDSMYREVTYKPKTIEEPKPRYQEAPRARNEPKGLSRSSSYHSNDESSFLVSKDAPPRFSYDSRDVSKSSLNLKDLPRLSLDSREFSMQNLNFSKTAKNDSDGKTQARPPSVVAKLMGLEALPDGNTGNNVPMSFVKKDSSEKIQVLSASRKEPGSPRWRNPDPSMKPMARFPMEPAPWKNPSKAAHHNNTVSSVYSEIEKRLKDLKFTQSGKDLRALQQILEAMQAKGLLETPRGSTFTSHMDHDEKLLNSVYMNNRKPQSDQTKRRVNYSMTNYESPIVIMKPAKLVERSGVPATSVISYDGISGLPKFQGNGYVENKKSSIKCSRATAKDQNSALNSVNIKYDRNLKTARSTGSVSPRMQQKKMEVEKGSRPPTPPDQRRQTIKQHAESNSPGGRRRSKNLNSYRNDDQLSDSAESQNSNRLENKYSIQSRGSKGSEVGQSKSRSRSPFKKTVSEEEPSEFSSPISVLDSVVCKDESPSPVRYKGKTLKDVTRDMEIDTNPAEVSPDSGGPTSEINRKKLQNIENLVQKLRRLNSSHDEARTDYIASLCENTNPDHRYISEILLASGLLLRDLGSNLANFQFHPSGHPINPELFSVLEQTKASKEEFSPDKNTLVISKEKFHRKLIFDSVNEILARKLSSTRKFVRTAMNAQKLLRELCSEIEVLHTGNFKCSSEEEDERWKNILCKDVDQSGKWVDFDDEISDAVLDIERLIFKDLVSEVVLGESARVVIKPGRRRQLFSK